MDSVWQQLTLMNLSPRQWVRASYLHRLVGILQTWRQGSWLMQWADPLGLVLVVTVVGLAPFISTTLIGLLLLACAAFWVLLTLSDDAGLGLTPIHLLVALYWGISVIATALSPVKTAALEGLIKLTLYILFFILMARLLRSPRLRSVLITVYLHVALLISVVGLRQWLFGADALATWVDPESTLAGTTRVYSYLGNPNLLAAYLVPAVVFSGAAVFAWKNVTAKLLAVMMCLVNAACLVLTFSRGGWIGLVVASFVSLILLVRWSSIHLPRFWRRWALPLVLGVSAAFVIVAVATVAPLRDRFFSIFEGREDSSNNFRLNVWAAVQEMIRDRPILGIGPGNDAFNYVYPRYQRTGFTALSAYSIFLEILVETGFIGFSCFLWLLLVTLNQGWSRLQQMRQTSDREGYWLMAAIATMTGMLAHGLVDTVWYRPQVSTLWWLMIAIVASYYWVDSSRSAAAVAATDNPEQ
ncbi:MAG: IctB family putative bicarbonate transporter [Oculatellaceae cyanobacterium bins.114]|nr:IctB family putative bicarbonate transporter [Oculatellaceae cyanobacterium bins.114]